MHERNRYRVTGTLDNKPFERTVIAQRGRYAIMKMRYTFPTISLMTAVLLGPA